MYVTLGAARDWAAYLVGVVSRHSLDRLNTSNILQKGLGKSIAVCNTVEPVLLKCDTTTRFQFTNWSIILAPLSTLMEGWAF